MIKKVFRSSGLILLLFIFIFVFSSCGSSSQSNYVYYTIRFNSNGGSKVEDQKIQEGQKIIKPSNPTKEGYTFDGWYYKDEEWSFVGYVVTENMTLEARYTKNKYLITLNNQVEAVKITGIMDGSKYEFDSQITLSAEGRLFKSTILWSRSDGVVYYGDNYTFNVPSYDLNITISIIPYSRNLNKIYFGTYPQTRVDATYANGLMDYSFDYDDTWTGYNYYVSSEQTSFMYYKDVDTDGDGIFDYRGVYFTQYRPDHCSEDVWENDNGYLTNTIYWFSYDSIEWDILEEDKGKALIVANLILDSQEYYSNRSGHNDSEGYANNYELSNIRKFLNETFYNTAFNDLEKISIETTVVDNGVESINPSAASHACNNTNDKLYLLSLTEVQSTYYSTLERTPEASDYAKCQGFFTDNYAWWLRSPSEYNYGAFHINYYGLPNTAYVDSTCVGVRPACWINL